MDDEREVIFSVNPFKELELSLAVIGLNTEQFLIEKTLKKI